MSKSSSFKFILFFLAVMQGVAGLLRGFNWVRLGENLFGQGLLLLPMLGVVAVMRGLFIAAVAFMYVLFVIGGLLGRNWAWWPGLGASIINLLLVLSALAQGVSVVEAIAWSVIPAILIFYFLTQRERDAFQGA